MTDKPDYSLSKFTRAQHTLAKSPTEEELVDAFAVVARVLEALRKVYPTMTLQLASSFLLVAKDQGLGVSEYAARMGIAQSVMSRHLADLGKHRRDHKPGLGLVIEKTNIMDRRCKQITLSLKGEAVAKEIASALAAGTKGPLARSRLMNTV